MIPGTEGYTTTGNTDNIMTDTELATIMKNQGFLTKTDAELDYVKKSELGDNINKVASSPRYVPPAVWDAIVIDSLNIEPIPYVTYKSPVGRMERPTFSEYQAKTESKGLFGLIGRFRNKQSVEDSPINIPNISNISNVNIESINTEMGELKSNVSNLYDGFGVLSNDDTFGLDEVINRHDRMIVANAKFSNLLSLDSMRIVKRTDDLNSKFAELSLEMQGVKVLAGKGTPIETVRLEAERISKVNAMDISMKNINGILNGTILPNNVDTWFSGMLGKFNTASASSMKGWPDVKGVFSTGGNIDSVKINSASSLVRNGNTIVLQLGDNVKSFQALFKDTFSMGDRSFTGIVDFIKNAQFGMGGLAGTLEDLDLPSDLSKVKTFMSSIDKDLNGPAGVKKNFNDLIDRYGGSLGSIRDKIGSSSGLGLRKKVTDLGGKIKSFKTRLDNLGVKNDFTIYVLNDKDISITDLVVSGVVFAVAGVPGLVYTASGNKIYMRVSGTTGWSALIIVQPKNWDGPSKTQGNKTFTYVDWYECENMADLPDAYNSIKTDIAGHYYTLSEGDVDDSGIRKEMVKAAVAFQTSQLKDSVAALKPDLDVINTDVNDTDTGLKDTFSKADITLPLPFSSSDMMSKLPNTFPTMFSKIISGMPTG